MLKFSNFSLLPWWRLKHSVKILANYKVGIRELSVPFMCRTQQRSNHVEYITEKHERFTLFSQHFVLHSYMLTRNTGRAIVSKQANFKRITTWGGTWYDFMQNTINIGLANKSRAMQGQLVTYSWSYSVEDTTTAYTYIARVCNNIKYDVLKVRINY